MNQRIFFVMSIIISSHMFNAAESPVSSDSSATVRTQKLPKPKNSGKKTGGEVARLRGSVDEVLARLGEFDGYDADCEHECVGKSKSNIRSHAKSY